MCCRSHYWIGAAERDHAEHVAFSADVKICRTLGCWRARLARRQY